MAKNIILSLILFLFACSPKITTTYFYKECSNPQDVIDSIYRSENINFDRNYLNWLRKQYISNDTSMISTYTNILKSNDNKTMLIFSVTDDSKDSISVIKYRKEIKK